MSGPNRFGATPRPATVFEFGKGYSGQAKEVGISPVIVFKINLKELNTEGHEGMAAVHIWTEDVTRTETATLANAMLIGEFAWASGYGSGKQRLDLTRGHVAMVGGTTRISLKAQLVPAIEGLPLVPWATKRVGVTINWYGNATEPPLISTPSVTLVDDGEGLFLGPFQQIPPQARRHWAYTADAGDAAGLTAEFHTSDQIPVRAKYAMLNPALNPSYIVHGVEFVRLSGASAIEAFNVFELWG